MRSPQSAHSACRDGWARVALSLVFVVASLALALPGPATAQDEQHRPVPSAACVPLTGAEAQEYASLLAEQEAGTLAEGQHACLLELDARAQCGVPQTAEPSSGGRIEEFAGYDWSAPQGTTYVELTEPIVLCDDTVNLGNWCDSWSVSGLSIGFDFAYNGASYSTAGVNTNGVLVLGSGPVDPYDWYPLSNPDTSNNCIAALGGDLTMGCDVGGCGDLSCKTLDTEPNRVFVVQWRHWTEPALANMEVNFQVRLYESSNKVEVVYGPFGGLDEINIGYQVGLRGSSNEEYSNRQCPELGCVAGWASSSPGDANTDTMTLSDVYYPESGLTWTWTPVAPLPNLGTSTKSAPASVLVGDPIPYTIDIINSSAGAAPGVVMSDPIPAGTTYNNDCAITPAGTGTCSYSGGTVTWSGDVPANSTVTVQFSVDTDLVDCGTTLINTATITQASISDVVRQANTLVGGATLGLLAQGFEGYSFPPGGWDWEYVYGMAQWFQASAGSYPTISPHGGSEMARLDSHSDTAGWSARLHTTDPLDLSGSGQPLFDFYMSHDTDYPTNLDKVEVQVSADGATWTTVGTVDRYDAAYTTPGWGSHSFDLSGYIGDPSVWIGFLGVSAHGNNIFLDDVTVRDVCTINSAPVVDAGTPQTISVNTASLHGSYTDDGLPNPPGSVTTTWSKESGPGTTDFANASLLETTATFSAEGTYVLRLTAYDGALTAYDEVTILYTSANAAPMVDAGADQSFSGVTNWIFLDATVTDDGLPYPPGHVTTTWTKVSGPGDMAFGLPDHVDTHAVFYAEGTYVLRLTANDGALVTSDDVSITWDAGTPDLYIAPASVRTALCPASTQAQALVIYNLGGADMTWSLSRETEMAWLTGGQGSGTLVPGAHENVSLSFDSTGLAAGTYTGSLLLATNDPDTPELHVPVSMTVTEAQGAAVCAAAVLDTSLCAPVGETRKLQVCNRGTESLSWTLSEGTAIDWLGEDPLGGTLGAGQCQDVAVTFDSTGLLPGSHTGTLLVASGDPFTPQLPVTLLLPGPKTWTGGANTTSWHDANNWSPPGVPAGDCSCGGDVILPAGKSVGLGVGQGTAYANDLTIASGASLSGGDGTLRVCGDWANSGTFSGSTGRVVFEKLTYMSGGGINSFFDLEIDYLENLLAGSEALTVAGEWLDGGYFNPQTSHVTFAGTNQAVSPRDTFGFYDLTIDGSVSFDGDSTVSHAYVIAPSASHDMGEFKIDGGSFVYVDGTLSNEETKTIPLGGTETFYDGRDQPSAVVTDTSVDAYLGGTLVATRKGTTIPADWYGTCAAQPDSVKRYYRIGSQVFNTGRDVTLRLYYDDLELNGITDEATIGIMHCWDGQWYGESGTYTRDTTANWVEVTGVDTLAPFILVGGMPWLDDPPYQDGGVGGDEYGEGYPPPPAGAGAGRRTEEVTTWHMTWDYRNLYVAVSGGFNAANDALNLYIDFDPAVPVNGGGVEKGNLDSPDYDKINAQFPFRGDFFAFVKADYDDCRRADGSGNWVACDAGSIVKSSAGSVTEIRIPWSAITGSGWPESFGWFGYLSYDNNGSNGVFAPAPAENPTPTGSSTLLNMPAVRYFTVPDTGLNQSGQFSHNSYTHIGGDVSDFGGIAVYDLTMNTPGATITRRTGADTWTIGRDLVVGAGTLSFGASSGAATVARDLVVGSGGVLALSSDLGGSLSVAGGMSNSGTIGGGSPLTFTGARWVTNNGTVTAPNVAFNAAGDQYLAGSGTWQSLTIGQGSAAVVHPAAGMTLKTVNLTVNKTLALGRDDLTLSMLAGPGTLSVPTGGSVTSAGGTLHVQGTFDLSVVGTWSAPLKVDSGAVKATSTSLVSTVSGEVTVAAGNMAVEAGKSLYLNGNVTVGSGATLAADGASLYFSGVGRTVTNDGSVTGVNVYFSAAGDQYLAGSGTWFKLYSPYATSTVVHPAAGMTLRTSNLSVFYGTLALGSGDLTVVGPSGAVTIYASGNVISGGGTAHLQGPVNLSVPGTWSAPVCVDSGTVTLSANSTFGGDLTISSGATVSIPLGKTLSMTGALTNYGALMQTKNVGTDSTAFLDIGTSYHGVEIDPEAAMGNTTVTVWGNQLCPNAAAGVLRCFEIDPGTLQTADVKFYFTEAERNSETLANLKVWHWMDPSWAQEPGTLTTGGSGDVQWVAVTGVDAYSPFMLGGGDPTSVELARFEAWPEGPRTVHVQWETAQEIDNLGFNLYRSNTRLGPKLKLNRVLIPTLVPPGSPFGAVYDWIDTYRLRPGRAYFYWLEDVDLSGHTTLHGPVRVRLP